MVIENKTRQPLVWVGSKTYWNKDIEGQINMLRAYRQTGSSIKPLVYSAAIDAGYQPPTRIDDVPVKFRGDRFYLRNSDLRI